MLATLASAAAAPPLAPPGAADAPTLDLYVGDERRTTLTTTFGTATEALAAAVLRAGDPGDAVEGRVVLAARIGGEVFEVIDPPSSALRPGDALSLVRETVAEEALDADRLAAEIGGYGNTSSDEERERRRKKRAKGRRPPPKRPAPCGSPELWVGFAAIPECSTRAFRHQKWTCDCFEWKRLRIRASALASDGTFLPMPYLCCYAYAYASKSFVQKRVEPSEYVCEASLTKDIMIPVG